MDYWDWKFLVKLFVVVVFAFIVLFLIIMVVNKKSNGSEKTWTNIAGRLYFGLVSVVSLFAFLILYWIWLYTGLEFSIISDEEYLEWSYFYYHDTPSSTCANEYTWKRQENITEKNEAEFMETCIKREIESNEIWREKEIKRRSYKLKENMIISVVWGTLFLIVFLIHYPKFRKMTKKD